MPSKYKDVFNHIDDHEYNRKKIRLIEEPNSYYAHQNFRSS